MIPLGYMLKKVVPPPKWMNAPNVDLVYSVSGCVSENFASYIPFWKHNGWWFFDDPSILQKVATENGIGSSDLTMFYYEAFESEYDDEKKIWLPISPEVSFTTDVKVPASKVLRGYDVVTFMVHTSAECSLLSCNSFASTVPTNRFCLFDEFHQARDALESDVFDNGEPGPSRIIAVYTTDPILDETKP